MHITLRQLEVFAEVHKVGRPLRRHEMLALSQSRGQRRAEPIWKWQLGVQAV
ncbi:hypothetical protein LNQ52_19130 [Klebsiella pneumoniae subsp. pneumoniae]|nr:hypothetical protein [Klebsiella pneumoniae subsp. pneumoniae]